MTSTQLALILTTMGLVVLAQAVGSVWLYRRVEVLTRQNNTRSDEPRSLVDPSVRPLETRLARLETIIGAGSDAKRGRRLDRRQIASADGPVLIAVPSLAASPSATSMAAAAVEFDRRFGPIWALSDLGNSLDEIARQSGYPVGQVELILGLRGAKSSPVRDVNVMASDQDETYA